MKLGYSRELDEPEINLISLIDVLFCLILFLVLTTSFNQRAALHLQLPQAQAGIVPEERAPLIHASQLPAALRAHSLLRRPRPTSAPSDAAPSSGAAGSGTKTTTESLVPAVAYTMPGATPIPRAPASAAPGPEKSTWTCVSCCVASRWNTVTAPESRAAAIT